MSAFQAVRRRFDSVHLLHFSGEDMYAIFHTNDNGACSSELYTELGQCYVSKSKDKLQQVVDKLNKKRSHRYLCVDQYYGPVSIVQL